MLNTFQTPNLSIESVIIYEVTKQTKWKEKYSQIRLADLQKQKEPTKESKRKTRSLFCLEE